MQYLIATTFEVVHYIALQTVHYKPLQEVHLSRYNQILGISDAEKVLDAVKDYVENGEVWVEKRRAGLFGLSFFFIWSEENSPLDNHVLILVWLIQTVLVFAEGLVSHTHQRLDLRISKQGSSRHIVVVLLALLHVHVNDIHTFSHRYLLQCKDSKMGAEW